MVGPHKGTTIRLPDDKGFVELTNEPEIQARGSREPTALVAYFLKMDETSAMEPAPSDVRLVLAAPGKKGSETIRALRRAEIGRSSGRQPICVQARPPSPRHVARHFKCEN